MTDVLLLNAGTIVGLMLIVWLISLPLHDVSIIDLVWGAGFVVVVWMTFFARPAESRSLLLPVLTTIWGVRLSAYLAWRNHGKPEDYRYRSMRERNGSRFPFVSLLTVFALQGAIMWLVSLPLQTAGTPVPERAWFRWTGVAVWATGAFFESVGDWQLACFKSDRSNQGHVMDRGLWRYTRHPNYFGDFCVWWGLYFVALGCGAPWWCVIGPTVMSVFLTKVSGVTLLEKTLIETRPEYADYVRRTNAFFPGQPKP